MEEKKVAKPGSIQMQLLLVGSNDGDFAFLGDLLARATGEQSRLKHARTVPEALSRMEQTTYDLLLCEYRAGDPTPFQLVNAMRERGLSAPVIFLSDHVDQATLAAAINAGAYDCVQTSGLNEHSLTQAVRYAVEMYCKDRQHQKSEDMLRKLWRAVEQSADLVIVTDRQGVIEYVNPSFEELTGFNRKEAVGRTPRILKSGQHPREFYRDMWKTILSGVVFRGVVANRKKDGEVFFAEKTITPLRDLEGRITHFISNDRDISERRTLEAQLLQAKKMDAIGRLAGGVAHDFNNMLMVITAYAELMLDGMPGNDSQRHKVQEILNTSRRASDLTRQLLAFGRKQVQALHILDLNSVIAEISKTLPRMIGEDIQLIVAPGKRLGRVKADPVQLGQIVMNLAANARDAMPGGGKLVIETSNIRLDESYVQQHSIVPMGDYVLLSITDSGQGIAPEDMPHIFEPFYTTKEEGKGTGLGLATVYGIVKQSGGFIWVYSEPGLGTTFKIYLPRSGKRVQEAEPSELPVVGPLHGSETLLLVEDEAAVRESETEFLRLNGYDVLQAKNGDEALAVARRHPGPIQLMITDVVMPQLGGPKLAQRLLAERRQMKVLFVSGYAEHTILQHGEIDVNDGFLQKPFSLKTLARKIRDVLGSDSKVESAASVS